MRLYLADFGHNLLTCSSDGGQFDVANIARYLEEYADSPTAVEVSIFCEAEDLKSAMDAAPPDLLGFWNHAWNKDLPNHSAFYPQCRRPGGLACMGGPTRMSGRFFVTRETVAILERQITHLLEREIAGTGRTGLDAALKFQCSIILLHSPLIQPSADEARGVGERDGRARRGNRRLMSLHEYPVPQRTMIAGAESRAQKKAGIKMFGDHSAWRGNFSHKLFARDLCRMALTGETATRL